MQVYSVVRLQALGVVPRKKRSRGGGQQALSLLRPLGQPRREPFDDGIVQALRARAPGRGAEGIGKLIRHGAEPIDQLVDSG